MTIVGLGLMGGSLALALRGQCREIIGAEADPAARAFALQHGFVHRTTDFDSALAASDLLILATPVRTILSQLAGISNLQPPTSNLQPPISILDLGSTKSQIVAAMQKLPPNFDPIGGHPMCGKEVSGIEHANADLYHGKTFILTPLERTSPNALALARELVTTISSIPLVLDAETHDAFAAAISHLPYAVSIALMQTALASGGEALWQMAASGFRDATRLAASDLTMMTDILLTNRVAVLDSLARFRSELDSLAVAIESGDAAILRAALESAQRQRSEMFK
ncbi:MAG: prephenate dehydrogenase/arogenate dehydrogenase family protein [Chloroflexi bacterium]|nr:prephenate dehydrogenase/arogenate dehydrogenase family protein [Chloroflexota bacterium]